jgi:ATP-dependent Clp protease ATP-binding subunit ClpB
LQEHLDKRLGQSTFQLEVPARARKFLLERGTSAEYGARELKRTLQRLLIQPLASLLSAGEISPGAHVRADLSARKDKLVMRDIANEALAPAC